jgi:hypothetical protein
MENKYFTPDIEDFHVGYEYETIYLKSVWTKESLNIMDAGWFFESYQNDAVPTEFRVPYLTKEQIEAEGWIEDKGLYKLRKNEDLFFTIDFNTDSYSLIINSYSKINTTFYSGNCILKGKCKDINTFRKIIKLLEI